MAGTAVVWVAEGTWPACIDAARAWVPEGDDVVLLHVAGGEVAAAHGALAGLLGRGRRGPDLDALTAEAVGALLDRAARRLGRPPGPSSAPAASSARWWRRRRGRRC